MNERQHFFSKIPVSGIMKIYIVLLCITITGTKTFAHEAYPEDFSLKVEDVNVITKQQAVITGKVVDEEGNSKGILKQVVRLSDASELVEFINTELM
jgi:ribosomal protein L23